MPLRLNNEVVAIIGFNYNYQSIQKRVENTSIGEKGYSFLVDEKGNIISHSNSDYVFSKNIVTDNVEVSPDHGKDILEADGSGQGEIEMAGENYSYIFNQVNP